MSYVRKTLYDGKHSHDELPWDELAFLDSCDQIAKVNYYDDDSAIVIKIYWDRKLDRIIVYDDGPYLSMKPYLTLRKVINGLGYKCGEIYVDKWYNGNDWIKDDSILDMCVSHAPLCYISVHPFQIDYSDEEFDILRCGCLLSCTCP